MLLDINTNALMFIAPEALIKHNYVGADQAEEKSVFQKIFYEQILINLRTYDTTSLVLYANDHLNNFIHLYLDNGTQVVYLFNHGNEIHNITVNNAELNTSKSIQIAIERNEENTTLHVNDNNITIGIGVLLLEEYSNKPWINPEKGILKIFPELRQLSNNFLFIEVLAPQRPPAPPTEYFQLNLGGFEPESLLKVSNNPPVLPGYVGCMRGFQIGDTLVNLSSKAKEVNDKGRSFDVAPLQKLVKF